MEVFSFSQSVSERRAANTAQPHGINLARKFRKTVCAECGFALYRFNEHAAQQRNSAAKRLPRRAFHPSEQRLAGQPSDLHGRAARKRLAEVVQVKEIQKQVAEYDQKNDGKKSQIFGYQQTNYVDDYEVGNIEL
jgi:hypothetical protein